MAPEPVSSFSIDIADPPHPGLDPRYRPSLDTLHEWMSDSNNYRPAPTAIGNDWLMEDVAHFAAIWGAKKMLQECRHWVSREVDPPCAETMWQDLHDKFTI